MGTLVGLLFGVGVVLTWHGWQTAAQPRRPSRRRRRDRLGELITRAGVESINSRGVLASCVTAAVVVTLVFSAVTKTVPVSMVFGVFAGYAPIALLRHRAHVRSRELREAWPDVVDNMASAVRAGLSLPEAIAQLGVRGPQPLRGAFERFGHDYRATSRFHDSLDALKERLADPTGDRIVEALRLARDVGGTDLGHILRTLSAFLRDDVRTRAELETRQSWVINAARLAVAAPWILLALISLRSSSVQAYQSTTGAIVLIVGAVLCVAAYRLMLRVGRLPAEERVLR